MIDVIFLSGAITKVIDFVRTSLDPGLTAPRWVWIAGSLVLGVTAALYWGLNVVPPGNLGAVGDEVLTGLAMGAAASGFHELFDFFSSTAKARFPNEYRKRP